MKLIEGKIKELYSIALDSKSKSDFIANVKKQYPKLFNSDDLEDSFIDWLETVYKDVMENEELGEALTIKTLQHDKEAPIMRNRYVEVNKLKETIKKIIREEIMTDSNL